MIKNANHSPIPGRTYNYLGARASIVWVYNSWLKGLLVDIKYDGAQEVTRLVKWDPTLFKKLQQAAA